MKEVLKEIFESIKAHKIRSMLTGFGIAWGMLILIVLLGAGNGFRTGILNMFSGYASNSIWITGNQVSDANTKGLQIGTRVNFSDNITRKIRNRFPQVKLTSHEINLTNSNTVNYMGNSGSFEVKGIQQDYMAIKLLDVEIGRTFNKMDHLDGRQVAIIGKRVKDILFQKEDCIGEFIDISGVFFQVVGVLEGGTLFSVMEQNKVYVPSKSLQEIFNLGREYNTFGILLDKDISIEHFESDLKSFLSEEIGFNKTDKNALFINNIQLQVKTFNNLFDGISDM